MEIEGSLLWLVIASELGGKVGARLLPVTVSVDRFDLMIDEA